MLSDTSKKDTFMREGAPFLVSLNFVVTGYMLHIYIKYLKLYSILKKFQDKKRQPPTLLHSPSTIQPPRNKSKGHRGED